MSIWLHLAFLICVALATFAQSLTGFAFGLILLGLVAMLHLAPLNEVSIAVSVLTLFNAAVTLAGSKTRLDISVLRPLLVTSLPGVVVGILLLGWLSGSQVTLLRVLLGGVILLCSLMLVMQTRPRAQRSGPLSFHIAGALTGLLGGLFASGGPPVVYHLYRQPLPYEIIRNTLVAVFAANALLRIALVLVQGHFTLNVLLLSAEALPLVLILSWLVKRYPPPLSLRAIRWIVFSLLVIAGGSLIGEALPALLER